MIRDFRTNIGLEFYVDEVLEFSFNGDYYAFYQPEYDHLVIRAKDENLTVFRYNEASTILLDGVAFVDIQNQLNDIFDSLSGGGGPASGLTTANNGLSVNPSGNAQLGGAGSDLIQNTDIETKDFRFKIEGNDPGFGYNQGLSINANSNQAQLFSTTQNSIIGWDSGLNRLQIQSGSLNNVTITNDGTNNVVLDPNGYNVTHNTSIYHTFNDGAGLASQFAIDSAELAMNYTNFSTGSSATQSIGQGSWNAGYQLTNVSTITLDDSRAQLMFQSGGSPELSRVLLETNQFTIDNTDGRNIATIIGDAASGIIRARVIDTVTNDESWVRTLLTGVDIYSSINGGNSSALAVTPDFISADGGFITGFALETLGNITLTPKKNIYFIDTTGGAGSFTLTIPAENCYAGYELTIKDASNNALLNQIFIDTALGAMELGVPVSIINNNGYVKLTYSGSIWFVTGRG